MIDRQFTQLWEYRLNGKILTTPSGAFAFERDPNAQLVYEKEID